MADLTKEMIDQMEAGPEMDALVAERVMGQAVIKQHWGALQTYIDRDMGNYKERKYFDLLPYSTDIAAAWQVLQAFNSYMLKRNKWLTSDEGEPPHYYAEMTRYKPEGFGWAYATTQELAICRAALKATLAS